MCKFCNLMFSIQVLRLATRLEHLQLINNTHLCRCCQSHDDCYNKIETNGKINLDPPFLNALAQSSNKVKNLALIILTYQYDYDQKTKKATCSKCTCMYARFSDTHTFPFLESQVWHLSQRRSEKFISSNLLDPIQVLSYFEVKQQKFLGTTVHLLHTFQTVCFLFFSSYTVMSLPVESFAPPFDK